MHHIETIWEKLRELDTNESWAFLGVDRVLEVSKGERIMKRHV